MPSRRAAQPPPPEALAPPVPERFIRSHVAYRTMGASDSHQIGCGFGAYLGHGLGNDRTVTRDYSGNIVLAGTGTYWDAEGAAYPLRPGSFFQRLPGRAHSMHVPHGARYAECWVHLSGALHLTLESLGVLSPRPPVLDPGIDLALIAAWNDEVDALRQALHRDLPRRLLALIGLLVAVHERHRGGGGEAPHARLVDEACRLLAADLADRRPLADLAARHHLSYERFRKVFRDRTGVSPGEYRIRRRIERARELLLAHSDLAIKAVAEELGYSNPFIFSAQFKQVVGVSPEVFRRRR
jgi:AraC-like DNA-binding protein